MAAGPVAHPRGGGGGCKGCIAPPPPSTSRSKKVTLVPQANVSETRKLGKFDVGIWPFKKFAPPFPWQNPGSAIERVAVVEGVKQGKARED